MIRGIDFYTHCLALAQSHPNIEFRVADIKSIRSGNGRVSVQLADGTEEHFDNATGFNSVPPVLPLQKGDIRLLQHFKGWVIETEEPRFETDKATLMDFRITQEAGTSFVYVLPVSERKALVEYTLFTESLLPRERYDEALQDYCKRFLNISQYRVLEEEFGIIPMTNQPFPRLKDGIIQLGTAGGQTKASSGYTFQFIQKQSARLAEALRKGDEKLSVKSDPWRFRFYDDTLLYVLHHRLYPGDQVFTRLFARNPAKRVLRFLDNESSPGEELRLLASLPTMPFLKAAIKKRRSY
jgi:lycopene beta-cyclase